jgi:2,3-bisphosphoglycerate-independent phosphoglycerate mutase
VAAYPLYRGVARLAGMDILETGSTPAEQFGAVARNWLDYDYFFIHIKKTDSSGEDGDLAAKVDAIEQVDAALPVLLDLKPDALAVVGDHCTPAPMKGHSWHPVPLLLNGPFCDIDPTERYTESEALRGAVGDIPADRLLGLMLANAGRLAKFGA